MKNKGWASRVAQASSVHAGSGGEGDVGIIFRRGTWANGVMHIAWLGLGLSQLYVFS